MAVDLRSVFPLDPEDGGDLEWFLGLCLSSEGGAWDVPRASDGIQYLRVVEHEPERIRICGRVWEIDSLIEWARRTDARRVEIGVTAGESPAMRLYARAGFVPVGEPQPLRPGSPLLAQPMRLELAP